jgi:ABC-2 type transport system ATP-binding protein
MSEQTAQADGASTTPSAGPVIQAKALSKWFGQVMALNRVDVTIAPGITGLLGPNGAGKTTFMRLLTGQLRPSQGSLTVLGEPVWNNHRLMARVGFCPDEDAFYDGFSGLEFVSLLGRLAGLRRADARRRAEEVLEQVGMTKHMHRDVRGYSRGMRQRTKLAQALVHDPEVLFLDEPLTGTDPVGRRELRALIAGLGEQGKHVVLSSHVLHEVESLTQTIVLIHRGRVVADGDVGVIRDLMDEHPHRVRLACDRPRALAARLVAIEGVVGVELDEAGAVRALTQDPARFFSTLPELVLEHDLEVTELTSEDDDLAAVFRYLVEQS